MEIPDLRVCSIGGIWVIGKWVSPEVIERPRMFKFVQLQQGTAIDLVPLPGDPEILDVYDVSMSYKPNEEMTKLYVAKTTGLTLAGPSGRLKQ